MREIPIGTDDFRTIRETHCLYVDKSLLIAEVLANSRILLIPRPRRFGKTLNMTMLQAFFDQKQDSRALFEGLAITRDSEAMTHLNGYPTVLLTLKSVSADSWEQAQVSIKELIADLYRAFRPTLNQLELDEEEQAFLKAVFEPSSVFGPLASALKRLTHWLFRATAKKVILLIDEYDTPIHAGHAHGYYSEIINFMRGFLGEALKGNPFLERAVVTGILRVGKESIYSGLNNLSVYTILDEPFSTCFGFSENEVAQLLLETHSPHPLNEVQSWYNGYVFGETTLYNPWSILKMLQTPKAPLMTYWIGTSGNELIADLIQNRSAMKTQELEALLLGQLLSCFIQESVAMADIDAQSVWSLLLFSGYLTPEHYDPKTKIAQLRLPNLEVRSFFESNVTQWLGEPSGIFALIDSLLALRLKEFAGHLAESIKSILSYHDVGPKTLEQTYHVFMVGLLASLSDRYEVLSNRESGYGRYDLALLPRKSGLPGFIFEFKQAGPKDLATTAEEALAQIGERDYASTMRQRGVTKIATLGLAFSGKRVALASAISESGQEGDGERANYTAGGEETSVVLPLSKQAKANSAADDTQKAILVGRIQALQQVKGKPISPEAKLLSLELAALEEIAEALAP